jgi:hypothetical protein
MPDVLVAGLLPRGATVRGFVMPIGQHKRATIVGPHRWQGKQLFTARSKIIYFVWSLFGHRNTESRIQRSGMTGSNPALPPFTPCRR